MTVRFYSSTAPEKQLVGSITSGQLTMVVSDTVGLPLSYPYTLAVDYETLGEELVQVSAAAGTTLTIVRAIDGTSAASHAAGARVRHTSSARDFADSRNHENSDDGVHGLSIGEEIVGTDKIQTLTNKTLVNATGTLRNIDINNIPTNIISFTNSPAGTSGAPWIDVTNGTDKHIEITGNGNVRILNNAAIDAAVNTRRIAVLMADGTTERFVVAGGGQATAFPRAGTADSNGGIKVIEPGDSTTRKAIQVRNSADTIDRFVAYAGGHVDILNSAPANAVLDVTGAAAQSASYLRVMDSTSAVQVQVDSAGRLEARRREFITNDVAPASVVSTIQGGAGQTANLTTWQNSGAVATARVKADGTADFTAESTGVAVFGVAGSFTLASQIAVIKAGTATIHLAITRTGADITPTAGGDLNPDIALGTVNNPYRPHTAFAGRTMTWAASNTVGTGSVMLNATTGDLTLVSWSTGGAFTTGTTLQVTMTYPLDFA